MKSETFSSQKTLTIKKFKRKKWLNRIIFLGGSISLIIGMIGIILPILPTTPFLLITAAAYAKSSKKFYKWLLNNRILGSYIRNYREGKGMPIKVKVITLILLWITIAISLLFMNNLIWIQLILLIVASMVSIHILFIRPKKNKNNLTEN
ncbi:MAG: DUF454 domain-containing protein [Candidatus Lokiarchaeota archaeon]|nr:DUF454 domain-containing protein [Candidatus Lokiarchaeota archaeon]